MRNRNRDRDRDDSDAAKKSRPAATFLKCRRQIRNDATRHPRTSRQLVERRFTDSQRQLKYQGLQKNGIWTFFSEWFDCSGTHKCKAVQVMEFALTERTDSNQSQTVLQCCSAMDDRNQTTENPARQLEVEI